MPMMVMAVLSLPQGQAAVVVVLFVVVAAAASRRLWVQSLLAILLFAFSAAASIWVLQLGWALAALGLLLILFGVIWKLIDSSPTSAPGSQSARAHASGGLIWPGLSLLVAPFANVFLLMPILRQYVQ